MMYVIKKDGTKEDFNIQKIVRAVNKSASRIMYDFKKDEIDFLCEYAEEKRSPWRRKKSLFRICTIL